MMTWKMAARTLDYNFVAFRTVFHLVLMLFDGIKRRDLEILLAPPLSPPPPSPPPHISRGEGGGGGRVSHSPEMLQGFQVETNQKVGGVSFNSWNRGGFPRGRAAGGGRGGG